MKKFLEIKIVPEWIITVLQNVRFSRAHCLVSGKLDSDHVITARQNRIRLSKEDL